MASEPTEQQGPARGELAWRATVTIVLLGIGWGARWIVAPGIDVEHFDFMAAALPPAERSHEALSVVAMWIRPVVASFIIVELAAMVVPRWRPMRSDAGMGRPRLVRAAIVLSGGMTLVQGMFIARWMRTNDLLDGGAGAVLLVLSMTAGTLVLLLASELIRLRGVGNGLALLIIVDESPVTIDLFATLWDIAGDDVQVLRRVLPALVILVGLVTATVRAARVAVPGAARVVRPLCGIMPALWSHLLVVAAVTYVPSLFGDGPWIEAMTAIGLTAVFGTLLTIALAPSGRAAREALPRSLAFVVALTVCDAFLSWSLGTPLTGNAALIVVLTAVVVDLARELAFRRRHGRVAMARTFHHVDVAAASVQTLVDAGIPALARASAHRGLLLFMGPHIPVDLLVPAGRLAEARATLEPPPP